MGLEHLVAFNVALLVAILSPGPSVLFLIRNTMAGGRRTGIATTLGLGLMATRWTVMALLGLDGIFRLFPWVYITLKVVGAAFLIYVAWNTWRHASAAFTASTSSIPHRNAFLGGLPLNLGNPKAVFLSTRAISQRYLAIKPALDRIATLALGAIGGHLLLDR